VISLLIGGLALRCVTIGPGVDALGLPGLAMTIAAGAAHVSLRVDDR